MDGLETRRGVPLVCVTDGKHHVRKFLREVLSEFNFTLYECVVVGELSAAAGGIAAGEVLRTLAAKDFDGKVLPFAQRDSAVIESIHELADQLGISLHPPLLMPFRN